MGAVILMEVKSVSGALTLIEYSQEKGTLTIADGKNKGKLLHSGMFNQTWELIREFLLLNYRAIYVSHIII